MDVFARQSGDIETTSVQRPTLYGAFQSSPEEIRKRPVLETGGCSTRRVHAEAIRISYALGQAQLGSSVITGQAMVGVRDLPISRDRIFAASLILEICPESFADPNFVNIILVTDELGHTTSYTYNSFGEPLIYHITNAAN